MQRINILIEKYVICVQGEMVYDVVFKLPYVHIKFM